MGFPSLGLFPSLLSPCAPAWMGDARWAPRAPSARRKVMLWTDGWTHRPWDEPLALVQPPPPPHSPRGWAAATPQSSSMGIWTEALQTHFLPWSRPLTGTGLAPGHPARLPSIRGSIAPRCSRGPSRPPCSHPVCSFLMSSRSGLEPGPFSSSGHLGGSQRIWGWLRRWVTKKLPLRREHTSRLPPSCCHLCDSAPPFGALLGLSAPPIPLPYGPRAGWS